MRSALSTDHELDRPHGRWWEALDAHTRLYLLANRAEGDLPAEVWRACIAAALRDGSIERDGWLDHLPARRLPVPITRYVDTLRTKRAILDE